MKRKSNSRPRLNNNEEQRDMTIFGEYDLNTASISDALDIANKKLDIANKENVELKKTVGQFLCFKAWLKCLVKD